MGRQNEDATDLWMIGSDSLTNVSSKYLSAFLAVFSPPDGRASMPLLYQEPSFSVSSTR